MKDTNTVSPGYYHSEECNLADFQKIIDQNSEIPQITEIIFSPNIYIPLLAFFTLIFITIFLRKLFYKK